jgi:hypothetical protein
VSEPADRPLLRVVRGEPTDAELAALVAVVTTQRASAAAQEGTSRPRPAWSHPARSVRRSLTPGPGAWRASGLPG